VVELKVARRYARALFELARDADTLNATGSQLVALAGPIRANPEVTEFLKNSLVDESKKQELMETLLTRMESGELLRKFVALLASRGRAALIPLIEQQFHEMADEHLGLVAAEVETPRPLTDDARQRLLRALTGATGKTVRLAERLRPELTAGIRVQLGSLLIDGTLERQLHELNRAMLS
jgi:F-type H+-transporting ATPase subunit delta